MSAADSPSWEALLATVRRDYPELYRAWFEELAAGRLEWGELWVEVADPARARYLHDQCARAFADAAMALTGRLLPVHFVSPGRSKPAAANADAIVEAALNPDYTFEQFVVGPSNRLAQAAGQAVCSQPGGIYNPLFVHGPSGLGKSHLLQAICTELRQRQPRLDVLYASCDNFVNDYVRAIEGGAVQAFRQRVRSADALILDDVQFLAGRESCQEEVFHTFNALHEARRQIVLSSDVGPSEIPTLQNRLVSRFNWGLVAQIDLPNRETRQAILQRKARLRGFEIPDELLDFIAERIESNIRHLEGALTRLITLTQIERRPMTLETARSALSQLDGRPARTLQVSDILDAVTQYYGLRLTELLGRRRSRSVSHPRQVAMYLARKLTPLSLEEIGAYFGNRDHSTVLHAERAIEEARATDAQTREAIQHLTRTLLAKH